MIFYPLVPLFIIAIVEYASHRHPGIKALISRLPSVAFTTPRTVIHWIVFSLGVLVTLRFGYLMFVRPFVDREIWQEYANMPGGILEAWYFFIGFYLPCLYIYLRCAFHFDQKYRAATN